MADNLQENEKTSYLKGFIITFLAFLFIPIVTMIIMYFTNDNFHYATNNTLTALPGVLGEHFKSLPTKEEKENIKLQIAKYYIDLDEDRLLDKLLIIKGEDEELYNDLLILLNKENPIKMKLIREKIRLSQLETNLLNRILEEIEDDKKEKINSYVDYYTSLKLPDTISEIERTYQSGEIKDNELAEFFNLMATENGSRYLYYLDNEIVEDIRYQIKKDKLNDFEREIAAMESKESQLEKLAHIYENETLNTQLNDLTNINKFNIKDLAVIYRNMSIKTAGRILSKIDDTEFITNLYQEISDLEKLNRQAENMPAYISEAIKIYENYDKKVEELGDIYRRISLDELVDTIENMVVGNRVYRRYDVNTEEIVFTQKNLAIDILRKLPAKRAAEVLEILRVERRIDLTQEFVLN
ncbi:MAG: hypothetical protein GX214_02490 [Clostridiales bacterium]|nr:hypothetical protein [Clostridiales bacterium]